MKASKYNTQTVMKYKGFFASVMEAERLVGDHTFGLPPGSALPVYCSGIFKEYPQNWMRGPGVFVVPVNANKGLWFNWTQNDAANTAVLPTVKGCNPITGLQTSGYHLERYDTKCPKHNKEFGPDRFCEECGYKWTPQNYACHPNTLWWDGFRAEDGTVRQFFFTEDEVRDVATKMIGKENTVPAFGFAFYRPKVERPRVSDSRMFFNGSTMMNSPDTWLLSSGGSYGTGTTPNGITWSYTNSGNLSGGISVGAKAMPTPTAAVYFCSLHSGDHVDDFSLGEVKCAAPAKPVRKGSHFGNLVRSRSVQNYQPKKEVAVGAGAKIAQDLVEDPYPLDTWKDTPDSVMTIYFVFKEEVDRMLEKGIVETTEKPEGMLEGLPVG